MRERWVTRTVMAAASLLLLLPGLVFGGLVFGGLVFGPAVPNAFGQTGDDQAGEDQARVDQAREDKARVDQEIDSLQEQVNEASAEEARLLALIDESSTRLAELDAKVGALDSKIGAVSGDLDDAQANLDTLEAEQRHTEARLEGATAELAAAKGALGKQAIAAYTGQSEAAQYARMLLGSASIDDLVTRRSYLKAVVGSQADLIAENERLRDQVGDLREQLETSRAQAQVRRDAVAAERERLQGARDEQDAVRQQSASEVTTQEGLRGEVLDRKDEFIAEMEDLARESAAIAETLRQRATARAAGSLDELPAGTGTLLFPIPGAPITSPFGPRLHPIYGSVRMHTGIDIGASTGEPIRASADGVVASAGGLGGYGSATIIEHGGGLATLYAHQSTILVSAGQQVTAGETIGRVGCTGSCTGPHLHYEVRRDGEPVNPSAYL